MRLILASQSSIRKSMLEAAGVSFRTVASAIDEALMKRDIEDRRVIARELAKAKAADISGREPDAWVIGSDSVVSVEGRLFAKPQTRDEAARHLRFFSNKMMELTSAVALARAGEVQWSHSETALLRVRELTDEFIQTYLDWEWPEVGYCVGVFRMEARGVHLFDHIAGDHFAILGMPLIPLMVALRERGLVPA